MTTIIKVLVFLCLFIGSSHADYLADAKVRDIERAKYWATKGYNFNPEYMAAYTMDAKVRDIERAKYWATKGYNFNPEYMGAYTMDAKVREIEQGKASIASTASSIYPKQLVGVAENGSQYGSLNKYGVPKTVHVSGYYRRDGTYVRSHYRGAPRY